MQKSKIMKKASQENATLTLRVTQEWLDDVDAWREAQAVPPTRSQLVKVAVEQFLKNHAVAKRSPK
jgi:hypothetical protein